MKGICPNCEAIRSLELVQTNEEIVVRGESFVIPVERYRCLSCGQDFKDPKSEEDVLDSAYKQYRQNHGMLKPDDIRNFRKKHDITQNELGSLLGWGVATLSRYENGALQNDAHEKMLRMAMEPHNLLKLIEEASAAITEEKRNRIIAELRVEDQESHSLERAYEELLGKYDPDEYSGFCKLNLEKLFNIILFFCRGDRVFKTKLNKLLFYADFQHFKEFAVSISGLRYARFAYGPVPENYGFYYDLLALDRKIDVEEITCDEGVAGERFSAIHEPNLALFSDTELKVLSNVKDYFKHFTSKRITDFSHREKGYQQTEDRQVISYQYASDLQPLEPSLT